MTTDELLTWLEAKQHEYGESDAQFAQRLGISRTLWHGVRTRRLPLAQRSAQGIVAAFPQLLPAVSALFFETPAKILEYTTKIGAKGTA